MPGKVYCFNCYNEPINQLNVNGLPAGTVAGWQASGGTIYTPVALPVPRARHGDGQQAAVFPNDMPTPMRIDWDSYTIQSSINLVGLPNVSLDDDLILYIAVNQLTLMTTRGFVLLTVPLTPAGKTSAAAAVLKSLAQPMYHAD
jgi:hypothetical protein